MVQPFKVITTSPTNLQFGYVNITTDTQLSTQVSFHIQRVGRFRHTDQQWWMIVNGSPKTFSYKMEGNYSDQHLISLVLYTCYSISHVCLSPNMAGASPITWPLTSCENTLYYTIVARSVITELIELKLIYTRFQWNYFAVFCHPNKR